MKLLYIAIGILIFENIFRGELLRFDRRIYLIIIWVPLILIIIQWIISFRKYSALRKANKKINKGKYEEAKVILESAVKKNKKENSITGSIQYSLALCNSRLGFFAESNEIINKMEISKSLNRLKIYSLGMKAVNMFFLGENYSEVKEILSILNKNKRIKIYLLLEAIIEKINKNDFESTEIFGVYKSTRELKFDFIFKGIFYFDKYARFLEKYLLFIFYDKSNETAKKEMIYNEIQEDLFYKVNYEILEKERIKK